MNSGFDPLLAKKSYRLVFSESVIASGVKKIAREIEGWSEHVLSSTGMQPIAMCILRGGVFFYADVLREAKVTFEMSFCSSWTYSSSSNQQMKEGRHFSLERVNVKDRAIVLIDDICDTGSTLDFVSRELVLRGAGEVRSAVLIHRLVPECLCSPTWSVFQHKGSEWFVGYGMEDCNHYSNLSSVYAID